MLSAERREDTTGRVPIAEVKEVSQAHFTEKCSAFLDFENGETVLGNQSEAVEPLNLESMEPNYQ